MVGEKIYLMECYMVMQIIITRQKSFVVIILIVSSSDIITPMNGTPGFSSFFYHAT